jgi:AcrR family transcriptional regulator
MIMSRGKAISHKKPGKAPDTDTGKSAGNREKILAAALRLFTRQGVDATPTAQISKEAGVSTGTLFHYFPNKNNLIDQLYLSIKKDLAVSVRSYDDETLMTKQRFEQCLRGYIAWGVANPEKVRFMDLFYNSPSISDDVKNQAYDDFTWMLELGDTAVREGVLPDLPHEFRIVMFSAVMNGILALIESGNSGMSQDEIIKNGLGMLWKH